MCRAERPRRPSRKLGVPRDGKLVNDRTDDTEELHAFQQGIRLVARLVKHAAVKLDQAEVAVEDTDRPRTIAGPEPASRATGLQGRKGPVSCPSL